MSFPKLLILIALVLFGTIGTIAFFKKPKTKVVLPETTTAGVPIEIELNQSTQVIDPVIAPLAANKQKPIEANAPAVANLPPALTLLQNKTSDETLPEANRIDEFFNKHDPKFPIVETITYKSRAAWQKGRPAWLSDYASHYATSRHFIARSLNGKRDYFKQDIAEGDRFNVLNVDKNIIFYLVVDLARSKMWFYYHDIDTNERVLVKTYQVGLGRPDSGKLSGLLTPLGKYSLGSKIAIYKPKTLGTHNGKQIEMVRIFGSRWIPFDKEVAGCSVTAKGFGIHGVPWIENKGELAEERSSLGKYESDGCVRLATEDIEELFSVIITKPTYIELVKDFHDAKLPGIEK